MSDIIVKYITKKCRLGHYRPDPDRNVKAMYCGDRKIWQNPDYQKGGKYWVNPNSLTRRAK